MGIFDKFFGKKKEASPPAPKAEKKQNFFITNSNDFGLGDIELGISGKVRVDGLLAIAALEKISKERNQEFHFNVMHTSLLEEGALTVPVVCAIGQDKYSVYFIYQEEELLKYKDLVTHISKTPYPNLIYFSSIPIYDGYTPKPIIEPFQLADLRHDKNAKVAGKFAMWWSTEKDPFFHQSKSFEYLSKINEWMNGYSSYMTGYVLRQTKVLQEQELKRMLLPEQSASFVIEGPEEKKIILDLSQEKGIRFLFPMDNTTVEYRERFLKGAMVDLAATIIPIMQNKLPKDENTDPNAHDWFNFMARLVKEKELSGEFNDHQIGIVEFNSQLN